MKWAIFLLGVGVLIGADGLLGYQVWHLHHLPTVTEDAYVASLSETRPLCPSTAFYSSTDIERVREELEVCGACRETTVFVADYMKLFREVNACNGGR